MSGTPLTLAETASVFGEMLTFRAHAGCRDGSERRAHHARGEGRGHAEHGGAPDRVLLFETRCTTSAGPARSCPTASARSGMQVQTESLGPAFEFTPEYDVFWAYMPHFIHSPFYVYAYAFGDCLVNALYAVFQSGHPGFQAKYLDMLRAGGTKRHKELLAPFGLDASDPAFWRRVWSDRRVYRRAGGGSVRAKSCTLRPLPLREGVGGRGRRRRQPLLDYAREMRRDPTPAEQKLWHKLRNHRLGGLKFRRQMPMGPFIADFYCFIGQTRSRTRRRVAHRLADGRTIATPGWRCEESECFVFSNRDVLSNLEGVLTAIQQRACGTPPPIPLPQGEGALGGTPCLTQSTCSAKSGAWRAPPAPWAASPRAWPASACSASRPIAQPTPRTCAQSSAA